jgi:hypothetical protein
MFQSDKGQTVLEYLILATIIMAGIVIGGPFLARSVSGHFRLLEDSASDSIGEDIRQAPVPPQPPGGCTCNPWTGSAVCGNMDPCTPSQRLYQRSCGICGMEQECRSEMDCCNDPEPIICGQNLNVNGSCDSGRVPPTLSKFSGFYGVCPGGWPVSDPRNCKIWERLYSMTCGAANPSNPAASVTYYACKNVKNEAKNCGPQCWDAVSSDGIPVTNSVECNPGDETNSDNLPTEIAYRYAGFDYNGTTYTDMPARPMSQQTSTGDMAMYGAFRVINTYFDPSYAYLDPYANQCAPGNPGYGTKPCHRCHPYGGGDLLNRRCEFVCPPGWCPAEVVTAGGVSFANATCEPCCGIDQVNQGNCGAGQCEARLGLCSATECTHAL